ncbi:hypothetical protein [Bradyrhizobium sp. OK095]|uniref:hypothetical protein n=1 Tax=Bradyrhizobium sp. OK095 TaxID=1882760 RepID=UPI00115F9392|nr:hypothetical protein [Bradyrhizobium sp. OK095]
MPDHQELGETANGWLNLAWEITIEALAKFQDSAGYLEQLSEENPEKSPLEAYWHQKRYRLNNAIALLQQSIELLLKTRIAETSPYLLIVGDPQSWPKASKAGEVRFSEFRTLDASQLCRAVSLATNTRLHSDFNSFFERIRTQRNKIAHLNAGNARVEAHKILVDILTGYRFLFPDGNWIEFRKKYMISTGEYSPISDYEEDFTHSNFLYELTAAVSSLENRYTKAFFGYDKRKRGVLCPNCKSLQTKYDDSEPKFAQKRRDGSVNCIACGATYTAQEYIDELAQWA